jgi:hypothetical protein
VAFAATPLLMGPLESLLDPFEAGELRAYYYETLMATLEAFEREMESERRRLHPTDMRPSEN